MSIYRLSGVGLNILRNSAVLVGKLKSKAYVTALVYLDVVNKVNQDFSCGPKLQGLSFKNCSNVTKH